jgi:hypothetical protein
MYNSFLCALCVLCGKNYQILKILLILSKNSYHFTTIMKNINHSFLSRGLIFSALFVSTPSLQAGQGGDYWTYDSSRGGIVHTVATNSQPTVICMQGRKVVMETHVDSKTGLVYKARFFHVDPDLTKKGMVIATVGLPELPDVQVNGKPLAFGAPTAVTFNGILAVEYPVSEGMAATRLVYPSMRNPVVVEQWQLKNVTNKTLTVKVTALDRMTNATQRTQLTWSTQGAETTALKPAAVAMFSNCLRAQLKDAPDDNAPVDVVHEQVGRFRLIQAAFFGPGRLVTPEPLLNVAFALQKLHVLETPIETCKGVITHNGSLTYSPGIWANDPVEYSSPLFPFFGDPGLNEASMNMYRIWQDFCKSNGIVPFPGSFESPALKLCQRERGDDAMVLYGLTKFLLFQGDRAAAEELWPLIEFAAASVLGHTTTNGIIASKTDEMEGRYPTGKANLSTSALAYGGYCLAASLAADLGKPEVARDFETRAAALRKAIDLYFGAEVEGFNTYRYYDGNTTLRGWILLPLAMGITERQEATVQALLSDKLWPHRMAGADILAESTRETEWGRETYYALRVLFKAGKTEEALDLTRRVVQAQIFGFRGPYPDEDAIDMLCPGSLYPRVFTEGLFGIVPVGLKSFDCTPWLPAAWPKMSLYNLRAFGRSWNLVVEREGALQKVTVTSDKKTIFTATGPAGKSYRVQL